MAIITLVIGAILGYITQLLITTNKNKQAITEKVLDQYFHVRSELSAELSKLANLSEFEKLDPNSIVTVRNNLAKIAFENFDFLPKEVLIELNCLYLCLSDHQKRVFRPKNELILPIEEGEINSFVKSIALVGNVMYSVPLQLRSSNENIRKVASIKCQTRGVFKSINQHFNMKHLMDWVKLSSKVSKID